MTISNTQTHPLNAALRILKPVLIGFVGYFLAGKLGLMMAIPPGFSSAVWPASGFALASMIIFRSHWLLLGVFLGSFSINLLIVNPDLIQLNLQQTKLPLIIALASTLQTWATFLIARTIYIRLFKKQYNKMIMLFILIVGPTGCLVASTIAVSALYFFGILTPDLLLINWFTWWLGDSLGILLFAPFIIFLFSNKIHFTIKQRLQTSIVTTILFLCVMALFNFSVNTHNNRLKLDFQKQASTHFVQIKQGFQINLNQLHAYSALFNSTPHIDTEAFRSFTAELLQSEHHFAGVGWTEIVNHEQRLQIEQKMKQQGYLDFTFTQFSENGVIASHKKDKYYPVLTILPEDANKAALGLDLGSNTVRKNALDNAKITGQAFATAPITLVQEKENQKATILYLPIYNKKSANKEFIGFVSGVINVNSVVRNIVDDAKNASLFVSIFDVTSIEPAALIQMDQPQTHSFFETMSEEFEFGNRKLLITIDAGPNLNEKDWSSWLILTFGLFIVAILQAFIFFILNQNKIIQQEVILKTQELNDEAKKSESANQAKSDFLANMSHELRTPLNAILGLINLCKKTVLSEQQSNYLNQASIASKTLLSLINHTLDYSKIEAGQLEVEENPVNLMSLLQKIYAIFNVISSQKNIEFKIICETTIPNIIISDALRLEQVLINLCGNALKFTEQGSVSILLTSKKLKDNRFDFKINIIDTGIGISEKQQLKLFQPFKQADSSTSRKFGGTGLGLTISKKIIENMGGSIDMISEINKGSQFTIHLNVLADENHEMALFNYQAPFDHDIIKTTEQSQSLNGLHILLVEDVMVNQIIAQELLEIHGATVVLADNGIQAIEKVESEAHIDLILMDIQMPKMDGYSATKKILENDQYKHIPIIAMTANAMQSDINKCKEAGMKAHISKPIDETIMLTTILNNIK